MSRIKLIEKILVKPEEIKKAPIEESHKSFLTEGKTYECLAAYTMPISRPGEKNLNGRIYSEKLWENVLEKKQGEGQYGLMDHPQNEGSTKDRWCVWHNLRFSEDHKLILCDAYLFGYWGEQVNEGMKAGGSVGISTVGLGEFLEDETNVNPDTYDLERPGDFVLDPSYEVFGTIEDKIDSISEEKPVKEDNTVVSKKKTTIKIEEDKKELPMGMTKIEEKNFRLQIKNFMKEAAAKEDLHEKKKEYTEILSYFEEGVAPSLKKEIEEKVTDINKEIQELTDKGLQLDNAQKEKEDLKKSTDEKDAMIEGLKKELEEVKGHYTDATELCDSLKVYSQKMTDKIKEKEEALRIKEAEKNGMISASEYKEAIAYIEKLEKEVSVLKEENQELKEDLLYAERMLESEDVEPKEKVQKIREKIVVKEPIKEKVSFRNDDEVMAYYKDILYLNPKVSQIKEDILKCKTVLEAQKKYLNLKATLEEDINYSPRDPNRIVSEGFIGEKRLGSVRSKRASSGFVISEGYQ